MVAETILDSSFPDAQFLAADYVLFRKDRTSIGAASERSDDVCEI